MKYSVEDLDMIDIIRDPVDQEEIKSLFYKFDKDRDGKLSVQEWKDFGPILFRADISIVVEEVRDQVPLFIPTPCSPP